MAAATKERGPNDKVALDTEGAAYLAETSLTPLDEKTLPVDTYMEETTALAANAEASGAKRQRRLQVLAAVAVLVLLVAAAVWFFLLRSPARVAPQAPPAAQKPEVVVVPSQPAAKPAPEELTSSFAPFWVEVPDGKGGSVFLTAKFSIISHSPEVPAELERSKLLLRDALYFYLKNKNAAYLTDAKNIEQIKKELADVLDGYLRSGQVEDMLFESYLSR